MFCRDKHVFLVSTKLLSRQKLYMWQLPPMIDILLVMVVVVGVAVVVVVLGVCVWVLNSITRGPVGQAECPVS